MSLISLLRRTILPRALALLAGSGIYMIAVLGLTLSSSAWAAAPGGGSVVGLKTIASNVSGTVESLAKMLEVISLIAGIGFIMAAFFKFHQHKLNPTQVPLSQGLTLILIGAGLTLFPILIPTAGTTFLGTKAKVSNVQGSGIENLIGGS
ncbi:MAG TPA: type IV secretion protein IcmD [Coxiellaceae bacterium]|nr:type IV secretion protein IcmD [Coxiellaceae bacterium]